MNANVVLDAQWANSAESHAQRGRRYRGRIAIAAAAIVVLGVGVWGLRADRSAGTTVGTEVDHDGGTFAVVDAWTIDDPMMAMMEGEGANSDQFAQSGMSMGQMSQMMSDAVPEGMKRVAVQLSLRAGSDSMAFPADEVRLQVGEVAYRPYTALLADGVLAAGDQLSGLVTFEVPVDAVAASFLLGPDTDAVSVDVSRGPGGRAPMVHDHEG